MMSVVFLLPATMLLAGLITVLVGIYCCYRACKGEEEDVGKAVAGIGALIVGGFLVIFSSFTLLNASSRVIKYQTIGNEIRLFFQENGVAETCKHFDCKGLSSSLDQATLTVEELNDKVERVGEALSQ